MLIDIDHYCTFDLAKVLAAAEKTPQTHGRQPFLNIPQTILDGVGTIHKRHVEQVTHSSPISSLDQLPSSANKATTFEKSLLTHKEKLSI